jgi:hypothetical protein
MRSMMIVVAGALALGASVATAATQDTAGSMCAYELSHGSEQLGHCSFNYFDKESKPLCFSSERSLQRYQQLSSHDVNKPGGENTKARS